MKKKRQKLVKKSKKNRQKSKNSTNKANQDLVVKPTELKATQTQINTITGCFNQSFKIIPNDTTTKNFISPNILLQFSIDINQILINTNSNAIRRGLDDKSKFLRHMQESVYTVLTKLWEKSITNLKRKVVTQLAEIQLVNTQPLHSICQRSSLQSISLMNLLVLESSQAACTQSCDELYLSNFSDFNKPTDKCDEVVKKSRPNYLIERDCHVFGGCVSDDADDEFFISSGAVYQSWPYVYEPGYQMQPLPQMPSPLLSISDEQIDYISELDPITIQSNKQPNQLPSYSLQNYGINLFHINETNNKKQRKKHRKNRFQNNNNSLSTSSSFFESDLTSDESSDDDSDSYRAYKHRHAIGLNSFNQYHSQSSLSDLGNQKMGQLRTNLYNTDSSSCENYSRGKFERNQWQTKRLATSFGDYNEVYYGRSLSNVKSMKYASCHNNQCLSSKNLIF